jgi:hypothetical protein
MKIALALTFSTLVLSGTFALAFTNDKQEPEVDCSMEALQPLLQEFVDAQTNSTGKSAVAAASLSSAKADLAAALEQCGIKPACPGPIPTP